MREIATLRGRDPIAKNGKTPGNLEASMSKHALSKHSVSKHPVSSRAFAAIVILPLVLSTACASHGAKDTESPRPVYAPDAATVGRTDGKSVEDLFAGRFAGVTVSQTASGGLQIRIRGGSTSFYGSDEPLFVVDGTPLTPGSGGIIYLEPSEIQKIEVLKNPADVAIYGIRGGNGVVKITTKRAGR